MKRRDIIKALESAGFEKIRDDGDHTIYYKRGFAPVSVPRHREINELTAKGILKSIGIK